jgi:hypothetical protein
MDKRTLIILALHNHTELSDLRQKLTDDVSLIKREICLLNQTEIFPDGSYSLKAELQQCKECYNYCRVPCCNIKLKPYQQTTLDGEYERN